MCCHQNSGQNHIKKTACKSFKDVLKLKYLGVTVTKSLVTFIVFIDYKVTEERCIIPDEYYEDNLVHFLSKFENVWSRLY
jgi:hypothetical protein